MFEESVKDKELYGRFMECLKNENKEFLGMTDSKIYRYGRYIKRVKQYSFHPKTLFAKISATKTAKRIAKMYPRVTTDSENPSETNYFSREKIAVYTSIFGGYDHVLEPAWKPDNCDFYIITDQDIDSKSTWKKIEPDADVLKDLNSNALRNRYYKMFPHKVKELKGYKYSIYIDGNIKPVSDLTELVNRISEYGLSFHRHSSRDCVYEEANVCVMSKKEKQTNVDEHMSYLEKEHFPKKYGMLECNVIVRDHSSDIMKAIMQDWWNEFLQHSKRDQLSLPFVLYKHGIHVQDVATLGNNVYMNYALRVVKHIEE